MTSVDDGDELLDAEEHEELGARLGLALVSVLGGLLGIVTFVGLWVCYPLPRGEHWPVPVIAVASPLILLAGYLSLRRRAGQAVGDWFAVGYVVALVAVGGLAVSTEVFRFLHERVVAALST